MIQRIQSIYLLLVAILMGLVAFSPIFTIGTQTESIPFFSFGIGEFSDIEFHTWGIFSFAIMSSLLSLITIFFYKKRKTQIKLGYVTALLIIVYYITTMVYLNAYLNKVDNSNITNIQFGIILPVAALLFDFLAIYKIKKDEKLVKSLDRIR